MMVVARLPYRAPFNWNALLAFCRLRAAPGVETVGNGCYRRTLEAAGRRGILEITADHGAGCLLLSQQGLGNTAPEAVVQRAAAVFDLAPPLGEISRTLCRDRTLAALLQRQPGIRVPGAWDGFELTVRAVLGQQISVKAATTLAGRIAARYGEPLMSADADLRCLFPTPERLRRARFSKLGLVRSRAATLRRVAAAVADGELRFDAAQSVSAFRARLTGIKGIGDWTAHYVAMRVLKDADALPASDLGLLKALDAPRRVSRATLVTRAEGWRPYRAYGAMLLWSSLPGSGG